MSAPAILPNSSVRVLIAPCGCVAAIDCTATVPGFCRSHAEAEEDYATGFREQLTERSWQVPSRDQEEVTA